MTSDGSLRVRQAQSGMTILGALFLIALLAVGGYFGYQWYMCRRLTSDSTEAQKCQSNCDGALAACERAGR